ncbi:TPR-like protein [Boletus coccyginus]|nr:TPR-like protein [Boletus coccyginus]
MGDLERAIALYRESLDLCPQGHPAQSLSLNGLSVGLSTRYQQLWKIEDLDEAIVLSRDALDLHPQGHRDRSVSLNNLVVDLSSRYKHLGTIEDLDEAIVFCQEALNLCPHGHPDRLMSLNNLAVDLFTRYKQLGRIEDLDEAITFDQDALDLRPLGHPDWLTSALSTLYDSEQLGEAEDLDEAIVLARQALELHPPGHSDQSVSLSAFVTALAARYKQLGGVEHLDVAIVLGREALDLRPKGHPGRSMSLNGLAAVLSAQYKQLGRVEHLDEAIALGLEALDLCPQGHPDRSMFLKCLADNLYTRYKQFGGVEDINEAIVLSREALGLGPQVHRYRSMLLNDPAVVLPPQYRKFRQMKDLDKAIVLSREALDLCPQRHPDRWMSLNVLVAILSTRCKQFGGEDDLDEAIVLGREALDLFPRGHPFQSYSLNNLAHHLCDRFTRLGQLEDKEEVFSLYSQLAHGPQLASSTDLYATRAWVRMAQHFQHPTILDAYQTSLRLLAQHLATQPPSLQHLATLKNLTSSLAVDAFSACLHEHAPAHAVELLEQGCVIWSQLARLSSLLKDLAISGRVGIPLADKFMWLASLIRKAVNSPGAGQHERLRHLNAKIHRVVTSIRDLPGLSRFLLPSLFPDLQCAAGEGPVIIVNASEYSCDALVVLLDRDPVHIPLQITQEGVRDLSTEPHTLAGQLQDTTRGLELLAFLCKLWDQIVSPVIDFLQTIHPPQSRIWWCPTAEFSVLPLHAAGPYREGQRNLADVYISSYTPTLTALIRARRHDPSSSSAQRKRFIAIGQAKAVGESELDSVGAELDGIGQVVDGLATFTRIYGEESCISRVVEELGKNDWVHLAYRSIPNAEKLFESAFALHDGHFTIQRIIGCDLKNPESVYLSACHTTVGDRVCPDRTIHLALAMQFARFRSVIGMMWEVDGSETNEIVSTFYKHMVDESGRLDHTRAAFALNKTMKSVDVPLDQQILYIHLGA